MSGAEKPHLLFIVGPTACGKSELAVEVAERAGACEIINCDSVQFFDGVEIGAAKPSADLRERVPHHLLGHVRLGETYTAGDFRRDALQVIEERANHGIRRFVPVGGSGFYVQALEKGMYDVPQIPDEVRQSLASDSQAAGGWLRLYNELKSRDPEAAEKIQPADRYRILRALEILRSHPQATLTSIRAEFEAQRAPAPFRVSKIGVFRRREVLRLRIEQRTRAMLDAGLIDEVRLLREKGLKDWAPLASVGYREVQAMLDGRLAPADLQSAIVTSTMQLAKRQMTWFKRDTEIQWFDSEAGWEKPAELALRVLTD